MLSVYLKTKLGQNVICERIDTGSNRFSSFKACAECDDVAEMYNPELWSKGSVVQCCYEPRKPWDNGASANPAILGANVPKGAAAAQSS